MFSVAMRRHAFKLAKKSKQNSSSFLSADILKFINNLIVKALTDYQTNHLQLSDFITF